MTRYLIKVTFTGGIHEGNICFLGRDGRLVRSVSLCSADDYYRTEASAKAAATRCNKQNDFERRLCPMSYGPRKYSAVAVEVRE